MNAYILKQIDQEIARLQQVRALLSDGATAPTTRSSSRATKTTRLKKRTMSPEARKRIAEAQRKRWAKAKSGA